MSSQNKALSAVKIDPEGGEGLKLSREQTSSVPTDVI